MADAKRCDICSTHYDPLKRGTRLQNTELGREDDVHDICTPSCLLSLAERRAPTHLVTISSDADDLSALIQRLVLTMDVLELDADEMWSGPNGATLVDTSLFQQAQVMVEEMVALVLHVQEPDASSSS